MDGFEEIKKLEYNSENYEPLIEDEKIRKAVRAWAEANELNEVYVQKDERFEDCVYFSSPYRIAYDISFRGNRTGSLNFDMNRFYIIEELCGDGE